MNNSNLDQTKTLLADMAAQARELSSAAGGSITDAMADWLAPQYLMAAHKKLSAAEGDRRWEILRMIVQDSAMLRRGDQMADRLSIERERLKLDQQRLVFDRKCAEKIKFSEFWKWTKCPEIKNKLWPPKKGGISEATMRKIESELNLL